MTFIKHIKWSLLLLPVISSAQSFQNSLSINTLYGAFSIFDKDFYRIDIQYEYFVRANVSIITQFEYGKLYSYSSYSSCEYEFMDLNYSGGSVSLEARWYQHKEPFAEGWFTGIFMKNMFLREDYYWEDYINSVKVNEKHYLPGLGINFGHRISINRFIIEPYIAYGYCFKRTLGSNEKIIGNGKDPELWPFMLHVALYAGYYF